MGSYFVRVLAAGSVGVALSVGLLAGPGAASPGGGSTGGTDAARLVVDGVVSEDRAVTDRVAASISASVRKARGRNLVVVTSDAARVQVRWRVGRKTVKKKLPVRAGRAKIRVPANARAIKVRALRSGSLGGTGWVKPASSRPSWDDDSYDFDTPLDPRQYEAELARLVNEARSQGRMCGSTWYPAVAPLRFDDRLAEAARRFAEDEVKRSYWKYSTPEGVKPGTWATELGYQGVVSWRSDIGLGCGADRAPEQEIGTMLGWSYSCESLMDAAVTDIGVGYYRDPDTGSSRRMILYGTSTS
ncbi:MAG: CAP domain-containing protein [Candidatus Nanopelagicales bacterium]|nr:CAP domain-containing protein [Candidatus Nanopelagicales bacterium]